MPHNVLVTGAGGVIGRRLVPALTERGHIVTAVYKTAPGTSVPAHVVTGDLFNAGVRAEAFGSLGANINEAVVVHLAGLADATFARTNRTYAFASNTSLTQVVLDSAVAATGVSRFVFASTGYVYGIGKVPFDENQTPDPRSVYAASKLAAEALVHGYAQETQIAGEILRIANVYSADSPESTVSGRILAQLRRGENVRVASRLPVRDFIFVHDVVSAICAILESKRTVGCRITNVSTGIGVSVGMLEATAMAAVGRTAAMTESTYSATDCLILANQTLRERTGWSPQYSLLDGLKATLDVT